MLIPLQSWHARKQGGSRPQACRIVSVAALLEPLLFSCERMRVLINTRAKNSVPFLASNHDSSKAADRYYYQHGIYEYTIVKITKPQTIIIQRTPIDDGYECPAARVPINR